MSNLCTRVAAGSPSVIPSGVYISSGAGQERSNGGIIYYNGTTPIANQSLILIPIGGAFDADAYGITCQAFANAETSIVSLQSAITSIQDQVSLLTNLSNTSSVGFEERIADQGLVWSMFLGVVIVVLTLRGIYNIFNRSPNGE